MTRTSRWRMMNGPGLALCRKVDRVVARIDHPERGTFASLTNALEYQLEQGADPETVRHLLRALLAFTRSAGLAPQDLGLAEDADADFARIAPKRRSPTRA